MMIACLRWLMNCPSALARSFSNWRFNRQLDATLKVMLQKDLSLSDRRLLLCLLGRFDEVERMNTKGARERKEGVRS